jgi:hypothetical protein
MNPFTWAAQSIKSRGTWRTVKVGFSAIADLGYDFRYGTDTAQQKDLEDLAFESENKIHGVHYQPSKIAPLSRLLQTFAYPGRVPSLILVRARAGSCCSRRSVDFAG